VPCRTHLPSQVPRIVVLWKESLGKLSEKAAQSLAEPGQYENLFPDFRQSLEAEEFIRKERQETVPAGAYAHLPVSHSVVTAPAPFPFQF
jgi:coatomer subunit beta'